MSTGYLGIDIGGTASRWAVVDEAGLLVGRGSAMGATAHVFNPAERARLEATLHDIDHQSAGFLPLRGAYIGITGYGDGLWRDVAPLAAEILKLPTDRLQITDDMDLAYHAAFAPGAGHLISAGTGSIGLHIAADNSVIRVGGRGLLIDDGGSGTWIALEALNLIYRRIDETGTPDDAAVLAEEIYAAMGGTDWDTARAYIYGGDRGKIGILASSVAKAASRGDAVAHSILQQAGAELARLGQALAKRAGKLPIGYVGGIVSLHPALKKSLIDTLLDYDVVFPQIDAALTAAELAAKKQET
ncbi:BadF/BadG/BcrA/BcrD ATPase family protein [Devosia rhodophyticola]|uniref:BadF/BadG/BcrA/BcrD ATPase family protein n=1 Tax=Devosia rhodophyticola TaxID=3026423 RepID=A0ABY7YYM3_9HYPH|nr:BadF/BadG/BcrA/BcrD ATPase family protein [Devosia rhodophyticola]WDR06252.1 BadF/BadG/BcrA/BcrD ATPase family protein [Devosia rhodophyticola]